MLRSSRASRSSRARMFAVMLIRLHQLAVLVGLPQERGRVMAHGPIGMRTECLQPVIVRGRHTDHEVSIRLGICRCQCRIETSCTPPKRDRGHASRSAAQPDVALLRASRTSRRCAVETEQGFPQLRQVVLDCTDARALAEFSARDSQQEWQQTRLGSPASARNPLVQRARRASIPRSPP
jgi:hypothetical protein